MNERVLITPTPKQAGAELGDCCAPFVCTRDAVTDLYDRIEELQQKLDAQVLINITASRRIAKLERFRDALPGALEGCIGPITADCTRRAIAAAEETKPTACCEAPAFCQYCGSPLGGKHE